MKANNRLHFLLKKYLDGDIDLIQQDELFELIAQESNNELISNEIEADLLAQDDSLTADLPPHIAEDIIRNILKSETEVNEIIALKSNKLKLINALAIAAAFIGVICLGYFSYNNYNKQNPSFEAIIPHDIEYAVNNTKGVKEIQLSDGTKVFLEPGSILHFDRQLKGDNREVYLEGEAFFNVKKNPRKPFLVYYNNIVTKVLGTSFRVGMNKSSGQFIVEVKTGRVQVSENAKLTKSEKIISPVIITPNQKAIYDVTSRRFETTIVNHPLQVATNEEVAIVEPHSLLFDQQKLLNVLGQIEKVYQIEIAVENAAMYNCVFTGDISNLDLFSSLKIICITTNSAYEVNGTKILIKGKGCN
jgi:hypothetical protein